MNTFCFAVASSDDRIDILDRCVRCIKNNKYYSDADIFLYFQGDKSFLKNKDVYKEVLYCDRLRGIFTPRYELMKFCADYDFIILIDDDVFLYEDTSYQNCMDFLNFNPKAGCCNICTSKGRLENSIELRSVMGKDYNIMGGIVFPKRAIKIILDYFADKEKDYTEDMFWLLLYVKGFDWYQDKSQKAIHMSSLKNKDNEYTGYIKMKIEKPYVPILSEYFDDAGYYFEERVERNLARIKRLNNINENGKRERMRNYGTTTN